MPGAAGRSYRAKCPIWRGFQTFDSSKQNKGQPNTHSRVIGRITHEPRTMGTWPQAISATQSVPVCRALVPGVRATLGHCGGGRMVLCGTNLRLGFPSPSLARSILSNSHKQFCRSCPHSRPIPMRSSSGAMASCNRANAARHTSSSRQGASLGRPRTRFSPRLLPGPGAANVHQSRALRSGATYFISATTCAA
jgi:hypothetical protein